MEFNNTFFRWFGLGSWDEGDFMYRTFGVEEHRFL